MVITPIPTVDPSVYDDMVSNISSMNAPGIIFAAGGVYTNIVGNLFYLFIWLMIFSMYWLAQRNVTLPSVMGIILGGVIIGMLPESYQPVAVALILISGASIIYYMYTERR